MYNEFDILGLPVSFDISLNDLESAYILKQRELYLRNAQEDDFIFLNKAYLGLKNMTSRALRIIDLFGGSQLGDDRDALAFMLEIHEIAEFDKNKALDIVIAKMEFCITQMKGVKLNTAEGIEKFRCYAILLQYCESFVKKIK